LAGSLVQSIGLINPKFEQNVITVATIYPGASPSEVENTVTKIEDASLKKHQKIDSLYESLSTVSITLNTKAKLTFPK
jgi:HAE1 family hydrophobic/amphiphilic exporter-1